MLSFIYLVYALLFSVSIFHVNAVDNLHTTSTIVTNLPGKSIVKNVGVEPTSTYTVWGIMNGTSGYEIMLDSKLDVNGNVVFIGEGSLFGTESDYGFFIGKYNKHGVLTFGKFLYDYVNYGYGSMSLDSNDNLIIAFVDYSLSGTLVVKFDVAGSVIWSTQLSDFRPFSARSDGMDNIYIGGGHYTDRKPMLSRISSTGVVEWTIDLMDGYFTQFDAIVAATNGNILACGSYYGSLYGDMKGDIDVFCINFNNTGGIVWAFQNGTSLADRVTDATVDADNNYYICGYTTGTWFSPNPSGSSQSFVMKIDSFGNILWGEQTFPRNPVSIAINPFSSSVYIAGSHFSGSEQLFFASFNSITGNVNYIESPTQNNPFPSTGKKILVDVTDNSIYVTGSASGDMLTGNDNGYNDNIFILKLREGTAPPPTAPPVLIPSESLLYNFPLALTLPEESQMKWRKSNTQQYRFSSQGNQLNFPSLQLLGRGRGLESNFQLTSPNILVWASYYLSRVGAGPSISLFNANSPTDRVIVEHAERKVTMRSLPDQTVSASSLQLGQEILEVNQFYTLVVAHQSFSGRTIALWYPGRDLASTFILDQLNNPPLARLQIAKSISGPIKIQLSTTGGLTDWVQYSNFKVKDNFLAEL